VNLAILSLQIDYRIVLHDGPFLLLSTSVHSIFFIWISMLCLATWSTNVHASTLSWLQRWRKGARFQGGRCLEIVGRSRFVRQSHGIFWGSVLDKWVASLASVDLATSPTSWRTRREAYCSRVGMCYDATANGYWHYSHVCDRVYVTVRCSSVCLSHLPAATSHGGFAFPFILTVQNFTLSSHPADLIFFNVWDNLRRL